MALTDQQLERYSRHITLKEIGVKGQKSSLPQKCLLSVQEVSEHLPQCTLLPQVLEL